MRIGGPPNPREGPSIVAPPPTRNPNPARLGRVSAADLGKMTAHRCRWKETVSWAVGGDERGGGSDVGVRRVAAGLAGRARGPARPTGRVADAGGRLGGPGR